jgi:UDP-glucose 4-epimerase
MKALVTGGAGFIGSHLVHALSGQGWEVVVLDNLSTGLRANLPSDCAMFEGEAGDDALLGRLLPGCDAIFHLAAVSSVQDSIDRPLNVHDSNLTATLSLLEAAAHHRVPRFVFSSSAAVYGDTGGHPARENMIPQPLSHYAVQKLASEHYCSVYHHLRGVETVCLRYFNIFGPRQRADSPYSGVIAKFIDAAQANRPLVIFGDGGQTRDFCHVSNVVAANILAATSESEKVAGGIFNIGVGSSVSVTQLAEAISAHCKGCPPPEHRAARPGEITFSQADISLSSQKLGYAPIGGFYDGLDELCRNYV